jgi:hypothetical protein
MSFSTPLKVKSGEESQRAHGQTLGFGTLKHDHG